MEFLIFFPEKVVLEIEQLVPGAEELVAGKGVGTIEHGVFRISDVSLDLLSVVWSAEWFASYVHFLYYISLFLII